ncbi:TPA: hypothetical protein QB278_002101 [Pasteurella multocida]|nr:hypothetical protein [Pasteurella multocida]
MDNNLLITLLGMIAIQLLVFFGYQFWREWREKIFNKQLTEFLKQHKD